MHIRLLILLISLPGAFIGARGPVINSTETVPSSPVGLEIELNLSNANATVSLLGKDKLSEKELRDWANLAGTNALIRKVKSSTDTAISAMRKTVSGQPLSEQEKRFQFEYVYRNLPTIRQFIQQLETSHDSIIQALKQRLSNYLPGNKSAKITLYGLIGGFSAGFAFTGDASAFYMGLHFYKNDVIGVTVSAEHELFHTLPSAGYDYHPVMEKLRGIDTAYEAPYYLLTHLYLEGSVEFISNGKSYISISPFLKNEFEHLSVNRNRSDATFYLIEHTILDSYRHPAELKFDQAYNLLFDWSWNNPAYFAGNEMMAALIAEFGDSYLQKSLQRDALYFVKDYITLSRTGKQKGTYQFSPEFERMLDSILTNIK